MEDVLYFAVLQSADYSPQQEALMKKQAITLEEVKGMTNQVQTLTQRGNCFWPFTGFLTEIGMKHLF